MANQLFRIDKLELSNFRCFNSCSIDLHDQLTLIIADNGLGKSTILDALAISLAPIVEKLSGSDVEFGIFESDINVKYETQGHLKFARFFSLPTKISVDGCFDSEVAGWTLDRRGEKFTFKTNVALGSLEQRLDDFRTSSSNSNPDLPVIVLYSTERASKALFFRIDSPDLGERFNGYDQCFSPLASHQTFFDWFSTQMEAIGQPSTTHGSYAPVKLLAAVNEAIRCIMQPAGWEHLDLGKLPPVNPKKEKDDRDKPDDEDNGDVRLLLAKHEDGRFLPVDYLSDGVRTMLRIVGDLAYRCACLNPHFGENAAKLTSGVVLVDEIDLHLHPSWQQKVVVLLQEAFPNIQFIMTTHSPQVLSTVDVNSIRVVRIKDGIGNVTTPDFQTKGVESADVLAEIMGIDPIPKVEESTWLQDYRNKIEQGTHDDAEAVALKEKLGRHFGDKHPLMLECERLIRFQEFKKKKKD